MSLDKIKIGDICDLQNGYAFKSKDYVDDSNTLNIRMSNIRPSGEFDPDHNIKYLPDNFSEKYSDFLLDEGDLVIAMTDMAGDPKILGVPTLVKNLNGRHFLMNQRVGKLHSFSPKTFVPFLRYMLSSPSLKYYYKGKGAGGLQLNISKKDILSAEIFLPPLPVQKQIVEKLDAAFADIDKAISATEKNIENAEALYAKKLDEYFDGIISLSNSKKLKEITTRLTNGYVGATRNIYQENGIPYLLAKYVKNNILTFDKKAFVSEEFNQKNKKSILKEDDVLLVQSGHIGHSAVVPEEHEGHNCHAMIVISSDKDFLSGTFLSLFFFKQT